MPSSSVPTGWKWRKLTDISRLESGHTPSRQKPEYWDGDIPWIGIRDATANHGRTLLDTNQHVTQHGIDNSSARILPANTVCLSRTASVGYVVVMGREMATSQDFVNWVCDESKLDYRFLKYVLLAENQSFSRFSHGTTHQTIYFPEVKAFHVCVPSIDEQRAIADVLQALDDKIEQNRRTGRVLEALARGTFEAWFVDFEPAKAKAAGQISFPGMPNDIFAALPDCLTDSSLGSIPLGWQVRPIGDLVTVKGGGTPSTKVAEYWDGGAHFWATPKDLSGLRDPVLLGTERRITDAGAECISSGVMPENTVLLSSRAPVGYTALAKVPIAVNQGFIAMTCDGPLPPHYVLHWTRSVLEEIKSRASGTTFPEISKAAFRPIQVVVPSPVIVAEFERFAQRLFDLIESYARQSRQLSELRDYLLPKLLSGAVRVRA
jgi:type I restriction enzyme S subunit